MTTAEDLSGKDGQLVIRFAYFCIRWTIFLFTCVLDGQLVMEYYATHVGLWVEIYSSLFSLPPLFSPDLANLACPFALHARRHELKPRACNHYSLKAH